MVNLLMVPCRGLHDPERLQPMRVNKMDVSQLRPQVYDADAVIK